MTTSLCATAFSRSDRGSVTRQSWLSHRQPKSAKAKTRTIQFVAEACFRFFVYYESIKRELKTNLYMSVGAKQDEKLKNLYAPHALCCTTKRKVDKQAKTQSRNPR